MIEMTHVTGALRTFAAVLIAAAFLLVLVVASVQQQALSQLRSHNIDQSYSVARDKLGEATTAGNNIRDANKVLAQLRQSTSKLEEQKDQAELDLYGRMQDVASVARTIARSKLCPLLLEPPSATAAPGPELWNTVQDCAQDSQVPPTATPKLTELLAPENNPTLLSRSISRLDREIKRNDRDIQQKEAENTKSQLTLTQAEAVTNALQDVVVLDDNSVISQLTWFPPALMQIVLCFVSGLFGALLLTLILAVYPDNDFHFASSASYWKRIFLGGIIAVAVYVVIGSGVSVLGSSRALIEDANFMSYTAIGILAGMFSERVARYLSKRGDVFAGADAKDKPDKPEGST